MFSIVSAGSFVQHLLVFIFHLDLDDTDLCLSRLPHLNDSRHSMPMVHVDPVIINRINVTVTRCRFSELHHC